MPYLFVGATVLSVIPIVILFRVFLERIRQNPDNLGQLMTRYMMGISLIEAIPILLIVIGMANLKPVSDITELYFPGGLVIIVAGFGALMIFLQQFGDLKVDTRVFRMISLAFIMAIPIVSFVGLIMMIPS